MISGTDFEKKQVLFVFASKGEKISFSNDNIVVRDSDGIIIHQSTCYRLFQVFIIGNVTLTSGIIQRAKKFGFAICLMTNTMRLYETIANNMEGNTILHKKQYSYDKNDIAKQIIYNKISNQKEAIILIRIKTENAKNTIRKIDGYLDKIQKEKLELQGMLGVEGSAARIYFKEVFSSTEWIGRKPRIKRDYINSTLDVGYTILFNIIDALLGIYGFDTYYGVLHKCYYMRKSLVCDLMEPIRPLIDLQVRKAINLGQCREEDFEVIDKRYLLKWKCSPKYISFLMEPLIKNKENIFIYIQNYYRNFMREKPASEFLGFNLRGGGYATGKL